MDKYFTPSIEDIRVGLEYEIENDPYAGIWDKEKIENLYDLENFAKYYKKDPDGNYRVPYLTKEQIEAEGWEYTGKSTDIWFKKEGSFDMYGWIAYKIICHYGVHDNKLTIYADDYGTPHHIFQGECKDINTFRYICKLLKI